LWHVWERREVHIVCWWGKIHFEDLSVDERIILKGILKKSFGRVWTGLIWFWVGTSGGLL
jgi:hypothetical protein